MHITWRQCADPRRLFLDMVHRRTPALNIIVFCLLARGSQGMTRWQGHLYLALVSAQPRPPTPRSVPSPWLSHDDTGLVSRQTKPALVLRMFVHTHARQHRESTVGCAGGSRAEGHAFPHTPAWFSHSNPLPAALCSATELTRPSPPKLGSNKARVGAPLSS
jgi:hypothetical protein